MDSEPIVVPETFFIYSVYVISSKKISLTKIPYVPEIPFAFLITPIMKSPIYLTLGNNRVNS